MICWCRNRVLRVGSGAAGEVVRTGAGRTVSWTGFAKRGWMGRHPGPARFRKRHPAANVTLWGGNRSSTICEPPSRRLAGAGARSCCVAGEPGIGKTTLVESFLADAAANGGCTVARGRCSERLAGSDAYLPVLEALDSLLQGSDGAAVERSMKAGGAGLVCPDRPALRRQRRVGGCSKRSRTPPRSG